MVRQSRLRWFGHLEHKKLGFGLQKYGGFGEKGMKFRGRIDLRSARKDMEMLGLEPEWALFRDVR